MQINFWYESAWTVRHEADKGQLLCRVSDAGPSGCVSTGTGPASESLQGRKPRDTDPAMNVCATLWGFVGGAGCWAAMQSARAAIVVRSAGGKTLVLPLTMVDLPWVGHDTGCAQHD
jgi:hypothetical protein